MVEHTDNHVDSIPTEEHGNFATPQDPVADANQRHPTPGEILEEFYRRPPWFYTRKKLSNKRVLQLITFLRSRRMRFLYAFLLLDTILYAKIYTGKYRLPINSHVMGILYVVFGSLAIASVFSGLKPWKAVAPALAIAAASAAVFDTSFYPVDLVFYALGAAIAWIVLWVLNSEKKEDLSGLPDEKCG